jgi:hypothetical protein
MEYNILENGWYQIPFVKSDGERTLVDSLVVTPEEYALLTPEGFEQKQQERFDNWLATIKEMELLPPFEFPVLPLPIEELL